MKLTRLSVICASLAALVLLQACERAPSKKGISTSDGFKESIRNMGGVAVIDDVVITRFPASGDQYVSIEFSLNAASYMLAATKQVLSDKGYTVDYELTPYVGAFVKIDTSSVKAASWSGKDTYRDKHHPKKPAKEKPKPTTMRVKNAEDGEAFESKPPFYMSKSIEGDSVYAAALFGFISSFPKFHDSFSANDTIRENLSVIGERIRAKYLLFSMAQGGSVSGAKSAAQGLFTGCLTGIASGGMVMVSVSTQSAMNSFVGLIDLDTKEMIWKNSMRFEGGDFTDKKFYSSKNWPRTLLYHLPPRGSK